MICRGFFTLTVTPPPPPPTNTRLIIPARRRASFDKAEMSTVAQFIRKGLTIRWDVFIFPNVHPDSLPNILGACERRNDQIVGGELKWS